LMLFYRLIHYMDHIPEIDTGLRNRNKELGGPLLRLFHDTKVLGDIKYALQKFLTERKVKKEKTIESALEPLIVKLVTENNTLRLPFAQIWNEVIKNIPGRLNPRNPNEYQTNEYGIVYMNTFSKKIVELFGAVREKKNNGIVLTFDEEKINELKGPSNEPEDEYTNTLEVESGGSESSDGSRICGHIIE
jgi:hypothetical protein